ncbi:hypothetical protein E5676_scaffold1779G00100 [Cucumis melo var. makuwa]|uniref:Uncharacterized protein n=1 Tax=Cucumis melo var. makuwa TaxID=1194695 RepID=A0A5D3CUJ3_CUCMM|nr:hypothetical protein E5676_scaffold1779G00100 [Cucumis melo var. makuwa]
MKAPPALRPPSDFLHPIANGTAPLHPFLFGSHTQPPFVPTFSFVQPATSARPHLRRCGSLSVSVVICITTRTYSRSRPPYFRSSYLSHATSRLSIVSTFNRAFFFGPIAAFTNFLLLRTPPDAAQKNRFELLTFAAVRVSKVTLEFRSATASVVGTNSLLFGMIRLDVELNKDFSYIFRWFSIDCGVTVSFIYGVVYLTGTVSFGIPRLICASFRITRLICTFFGIIRLICVSFRIARLICASFGITRLICASIEIIRLICASFGITRLMCAFYGTTRLFM